MGRQTGIDRVDARAYVGCNHWIELVVDASRPFWFVKTHLQDEDWGQTAGATSNLFNLRN
jgi:hypothetical protein